MIIAQKCVLLLVTAPWARAYKFPDSSDLKDAVRAWVDDETTANATYGDISGWDVSSVTTFYRMFSDDDLLTNFNGDISAWNVSSVTDMSWAFASSAFIGDMSAWDVLSAWDVSRVTTMRGMFDTSTFNGDISAWDVSSVTSMSGMFIDNAAFNDDLSAWDVSSVTNFESMFSGACSFDQDLCWDIATDANTDYMFLIMYACPGNPADPISSLDCAPTPGPTTIAPTPGPTTITATSRAAYLAPGVGAAMLTIAVTLATAI